MSDIKLNSYWKFTLCGDDCTPFKVVKTWKEQGTPMLGIEEQGSEKLQYKISRKQFLKEFTKISKLEAYLEQLDV